MNPEKNVAGSEMTMIGPSQGLEPVIAHTRMKYEVFLSCSWSDREAAGRILRELSKHKISAWLDAKTITPGDSLKGTISQAIRQSHAIILLVSRSYFDSPYARLEISNAVELQKTLHKQLIPCLLEKDITLPSELSDLACIRMASTPAREWVKNIESVIAAAKIREMNEVNKVENELKASFICSEMAMLRTMEMERGNKIRELTVSVRSDVVRSIEATEKIFVKSRVYYFIFLITAIILGALNLIISTRSQIGALDVAWVVVAVAVASYTFWLSFRLRNRLASVRNKVHVDLGETHRFSNNENGGAVFAAARASEGQILKWVMERISSKKMIISIPDSIRPEDVEMCIEERFGVMEEIDVLRRPVTEAQHLKASEM